jgi:NAD(P)-dependent dehydrogenase (short-subunit alcohol dehydrogenase family)
MLEGGGGAILNLSSANGIVGVAGLAAFTTTKHGLIGLTRRAALELADKGIRVHAIAPGHVATPRMHEMPQDALAGIGALHPMGRLATPQEVAELAVFLLSDRAGFCTGGVYPIDGGYTSR